MYNYIRQLVCRAITFKMRTSVYFNQNDYKNVYWKGKIYPRSKMVEGAKNLPWETEAYNKV